MQEKNYLSVTIFILIIFVLLMGGNYLIKNKKQASTSNIKDIRIDKNKDYIYFTDEEVVSEELDLEYKTINFNFDNSNLNDLATKLNNETSIAKASIITLDNKNINKKDIVLEVSDTNNIYEAPYLKYEVMESSKYITLETIKGTVNITKDEDNNTINYYTIDKETGKLLTQEEIKGIGKLSDSTIKNTIDNYLVAKDNTSISKYELYIDKYGSIYLNLLVNSDDITYNDTVKIN